MCEPADLSYKESTWEFAHDLEDEVIADLFSRNRAPSGPKPIPRSYPPTYLPVRMLHGTTCPLALLPSYPPPPPTFLLLFPVPCRCPRVEYAVLRACV